MKTPRKSKVLCDGKRVRWAPDMHDFSQKDEDGWLEDVRDLAEPSFHSFKDDPADPTWYALCSRCSLRQWTPAGYLKRVYAREHLAPMIMERRPLFGFSR